MNSFYIAFSALLLLLTLLVVVLLIFPFRAHLKGWLGVFMLGMIGLPLGLYYHWGALKPVNEARALDKIDQTLSYLNEHPDLKAEQIHAQFKKLAKEIKDSPVALARLGSIYQQLGRWHEASQLFAQAMQASDNREYIIQWIYSLLPQGKLPLEARVAAEQILAHDEDNTLLNLLAIDDYLQGLYPAAIEKWQWLLKNDKALTLERQSVLQNAIDKALALNAN